MAIVPPAPAATLMEDKLDRQRTCKSVALGPVIPRLEMSRSPVPLLVKVTVR